MPKICLQRTSTVLVLAFMNCCRPPNLLLSKIPTTPMLEHGKHVYVNLELSSFGSCPLQSGLLFGLNSLKSTDVAWAHTSHSLLPQSLHSRSFTPCSWQCKHFASPSHFRQLSNFGSCPLLTLHLFCLKGLVCFNPCMALCISQLKFGEPWHLFPHSQPKQSQQYRILHPSCVQTN